MCEPIYQLEGITLWTCPTLIRCPSVSNLTDIYRNNSNNTPITEAISPNHTQVQNESRISLKTTSNSTRVNSTRVNSTRVNSTRVNSTRINSTLVNSTRINSTLVNSTRVNQSDPTDPIHPLPKPSIPKPSIIYLRHNIYNNSNTSLGNTTCLCDLSQLAWLHSLWVVPVLFVILLVLIRKYRRPQQIRNIYIPRVTTGLTRSRSWPQIRLAETVHIVPASDPGNVSERGVFLTGIL
jgi:hypothetical protein